MPPGTGRFFGNLWRHHGFALAWIAGVTSSLPALFAGPFSDDFMQHLVLEGAVNDVPMGPATLYDFTAGGSALVWMQRGYLPWQTDPQLVLRFFRPVSSLSVALDDALFGRAELPAHLVNLAWFLGLLAITFALFRRLLPPARARLAALLYAVAGGHAMNLAWIATRHLLIGALLSSLAFWFHLERREPASSTSFRVPCWAPVSTLALALAASESSLAGVALILGYELFGREDALGSRFKASAPAILLASAYCAAYGLAGYGTEHSGLYVSPFSQPLAFAQALLTRWPVLVGEMADALPASLWGAAPAASSALGILGAGFAALIALVLWRARLEPPQRLRVRFLAAAALAGSLPMAGGVPDGRMLAIPLVCSTALVASAIEVAWTSARQLSGWSRLGFRCASLGLCVVHVGLAALVRIGVGQLIAQLSRAQKRLAETANLSACQPGDSALILTGADPSLSLSGASSLAYYRPGLQQRLSAVFVLSMAPHDQRLTRSGQHSIELEVLNLPRRHNIFELLFRDTPLAPGYQVDLGILAARVLRTEAGLPTRVRFRVPEHNCVLSLEHQRLISFELPGLGKSRRVPHEVGPLGL